jgi:hypothetical protein
MPHHDERPANALARGPAKPQDIDRARREVESAGAETSVQEVRAAAETVRAATLRTDTARPES